MNISPHFTAGEFFCRHCHKLPPQGIDKKLLNKLEELRMYFRKPVHINSGYRCPFHNKQVGGVQDSQHVKGKAADITVGGIEVCDLAWQAARVFGWLSGVGIYPEHHGNFVHVDTRTWHARWPRAIWKNLRPEK